MGFYLEAALLLLFTCSQETKLLEGGEVKGSFF